MSKPEIYVSIDIETDGPVAGINSMLSLGAAAFVDDPVTPLDEFYDKLAPLFGMVSNPETMKWWETQTEAYAEATRNPSAPHEVVAAFNIWCEKLSSDGKLIAVAWPAAFDFPFVNYYMHAFLGKNPLGFACLDIRSYANGLMKEANYYGLKEEEVRHVVGEIDKTDLRPHFAIDDAIEQGRLFMALRKLTSQ